MANYANLLAQIAANIYSNNNQDITGDGLQLQLNAMVASLGAGYQFMGVAHPADTPSGYADLRAFWLAGEPGTYTNFGGLVLADGEVAVIKYDDNGWSKLATGIASAAQMSFSDALLSGKMTSFSNFPEFSGSIESTTIVEYGSCKFKVIEVNGGSSFSITMGTLTRIAVVKSFSPVFNYPYSLDFATGETARRQIMGGTIALTLPADAKYVLVQIVTSAGVTLPFYSCLIDGEDISLGEQVENLHDRINDNEAGLINSSSSRIDKLTITGNNAYITSFPVIAGRAYLINVKSTTAQSVNMAFYVEGHSSPNVSFSATGKKAFYAMYDGFLAVYISGGAQTINIEIEQYPIIVAADSATQFSVYVLQGSKGTHLRHIFTRENYSKLVRYGESGQATHSEVCGDCYMPTYIYDKDNYIIQGNANFINWVDKTNEGSYAGEGHGATFSEYVKFFIDGKPYLPTIPGQNMTGGSTFRFIEKNNIYAIDTTQPNFSSSQATPFFDENGDKILSTIHWLDCEYSADNEINIRHRLKIMRDNTIFTYCFGGMLELEKDNFTDIIINNAESSENSYEFDADTSSFIMTPEGGSADTFVNGYNAECDEILGSGDKYIVRQRMFSQKAFIEFRHYTDSAYRIKMYQQPVVTIGVTSHLGGEPDVFNTGDMIECSLSRKIEYNG